MTPDPLEDLRLLGLRPGAGLGDLKAARRRAVSELHPDRRGAAASPELAAVNAAFRRLEAFHRRHGRLPGTTDPRRIPATASPGSTPRRGRWLIAASVLAVALFVAWPQVPPPGTEVPAADGSTRDVAVDDALNGAGVAADAAAPLGERVELIDFGTPAADVERLAGPPMFRSAERWQYGPSEVRFADGFVSGWHSSPLRPLPVAPDRSGSAID